ncbi:hypothetical protein G6M78_19730 [Agrobacterium tumefaciens]|uniref:DUF945 domain-containing protein n=1 Tax=Agrobacterium tumefaciens TaxID=358 RepID=A0A546Y8I9_AGRTU|nr:MULTISPECIES: hypothetical protein [Rhizobium/Agrobacterium group]NTE57299.1 hypothetical protein [Agrobacterium tumefaciens]NTE71119.1 hypothetical protein [Agrobacterium tumefaciens]PYG57678.1 hypothetical protein N434_03194 [Rhizobium sp. UGM030330-04]TRB09316.1 hypothetical protein EXN61_05485 [Agrobacterium tumefaciens]UXT48516.1 hypothetical protein FY136_04400 [Agrobacterium tumefaciens]
MRLKSTRQVLFASAALLTLSAPAFALDGGDVLKKINAAYATQGGEIAAGSVAVNGTTVTLNGVTFNAAADPAKKIPVGNITLEGVEENNGGYTIKNARFDNIDYKQENVEIKASDIYMSGLVIPADATTGTVDALMFYDEAHSGPVSVSIDGKQAFSLEESTATMSVSDDKASIGFELDASGFKADLSEVTDPATKDAIEKLELKALSGDMTMSGSWEVASGTVDVEEYAINLDNVGRLNMSFGFSGYTLDFIKSMQETVKAQAANPNKEQADQAASLAMLGLMQQLSFVNAEISFEDASITKRAIDYAASQQGMTGDQLAQTIKGMAPIMMASLNVPDLQNMVSAAVNAYIDNPKNFSITAEPEKPVPFPMIMGAAMGAPNTLPKMLGVTVTANE